MGKYVEKAKQIRNDGSLGYNCAQAVTVAFSDVTGLTEEQSAKVAANFGGGMRRGATCGAITGGLMVLGLLGIEQGPIIADYYQAFRNRHEGCLECADLLRMNAEKGYQKKTHCDNMVYEAVHIIETLIEKS